MNLEFLSLLVALVVFGLRTARIHGHPGFDKKNPMLGPYYQGDILDTPVKSRSGVTHPSQRWPRKTLVYNIENGFTAEEEKVISVAMSEIQTKTCIRFKRKTFWDWDYVLFRKVPQGCSSNLGRRRGQQLINLESGCFRSSHATVMHEIIHALGFDHEHNRQDRDNYINVFYDRIKPGNSHGRYKEINSLSEEYRSAFDKTTQSNTFGVSYDFYSVMHYPKDAFAKNPLEITIAPKTPGVVIGESRELSTGDVEKLKRMYGC